MQIEKHITVIYLALQGSVVLDDTNPTEIAQVLYPDGYEIYQIYQQKYREKAKQSTNQPGEGSTTNRSTQDSSKGT
jgi:hypothetical protein